MVKSAWIAEIRGAKTYTARLMLYDLYSHRKVVGSIMDSR